MMNVRWTAIASAEFKAITRYLAERSPQGADRISSAILDAADFLADFNTGRRSRIKDAYEKVVVTTPYIILYEIRGSGGKQDVFILRIVHGARNWAVQSGGSGDDKTGA